MQVTLDIEMLVDFELTPTGVSISAVTLGGLDVIDQFAEADLNHLGEVVLAAGKDQGEIE